MVMLRVAPRRACSSIAAIVLLLGLAASVPARINTHRVRFKRGRTTAVLKGAVVRGDRDRYLLDARAGQTMIVHITSVEKNAVFTIYQPGGQKPIPGTEEGTDRMDWTGKLPKTGTYAISVGGTRGNATYTLEVTIRN
jgi:hypothetical protein